MELYEVMRHLSGSRDFHDLDVPDDVIYRALDSARFAPSGGNRQPWRIVIVRDSTTKMRLKELYQAPWDDYVAKRYGPDSELSEKRKKKLYEGNRFAATMEKTPVFLLVWADMSELELTDIDLDRPSIVGGGSVYPFVQNLQLAMRNEGVGTRITTLMVHKENAVREMVGAPKNTALAAVLLIGYPKHFPTKLSRRPVEDFAFTEQFGGPPLRAKDTKQDAGGYP